MVAMVPMIFPVDLVIFSSLLIEVSLERNIIGVVDEILDLVHYSL